MPSRKIVCCLQLIVTLVILYPSILLAEEGGPRITRLAPVEGVKGIPGVPGQTRPKWGEMVGNFNTYTGDGWFKNTLYTLQGRGEVSFPIELYYSTEVVDIESANNEDRQASWVGMGWGTEAPFIWGYLSADIYEEEPGMPRSIEGITTKYSLFWSGVEDPVKTSGTWKFTFRSYWKLTKTLDGNGYVQSFTITDLDGTKYTFGHRRLTVVSLHDDEGLVEDYEADVPYRWDLTSIEDVTGQNSITISYQDVTAICYLEGWPEEWEEEYTQASYLYRITEDASGRVVEFVRENRTDYPSGTNYWARIFEKKRLDYFYLKPSAGSGIVLVKYDFSYGSYHGSGSMQKLMLASVKQKKKGTADGLPSWSFTYRTSDPNDGALQTLTFPEGGTKTFTYANRGSQGNNWRVLSIASDHKMGAGAETTSYAPLDSTGGGCNKYYYLKMRVSPPGNIGCREYEMISPVLGACPTNPLLR